MSRLARLQLVCIGALGLLMIRLIDLQVIRGGHYRLLAEQNRLRLVPEQAPRGLILDRRARVLASNQTVFRVAIVPQEVQDLPAVLARVSEFVHRSPDVLLREFKKERSLAFIPATIVRRVPKEVALRIEEERWRLPGLFVQAETIRHYPLGSTAAHLLGYLSQPTPEELPVLKQYGVRPKHLVGRRGLEQRLDDALRGRSGGLMVEVNHRARQVRMLGRREPQAGTPVVLTIDAQLQSLIEQAFGVQPGAAVVLDPQTGEVLAMASVPAFSPETFTASDAQTITWLFNDAQSPMMNRASVGAYQPGSIIKVVTAGAALEERLITSQTTITCAGGMPLGDRIFHCWNRDGHGPMMLSDALMQSCNVYFMQAGRRLGLARLRGAMEQAGLSRKTGWALEEQGGHLPTRRLTQGEVALLAIGQGEVSLTPLQAAVMVSVFANKGWLVQPWVVRRIGDRDAQHISRRRLPWSLSTLEAVRRGMQEVVQNEYGTGHRAATPSITIAGKTGTAQTGLPGRTHAWFIGFCPIEQPRAAMAILAEYGGSGGELPAEIAKTICEYVALPDTL